jgi:multiple sugar transport system ATP-binding protein
VTTLYVTHDQIEAMTLAHRVALLDRGVLQQLDTPARIYNDPANLFVAGFIGAPSMNFLRGALRGRRLTGQGSRRPPPCTPTCRRPWSACGPRTAASTADGRAGSTAASTRSS